MATTYSQSLTAGQTSSKERTAALANRSSATRSPKARAGGQVWLPMATISEPAATLVVF